jgi:chromosome segregation ATPase
LATVAAARAEREKDLEEECRVHEQRLRDCEREVEALKAEAEIRDAEHAALCNRDQASHEEIEALRAELSDARQARHDIETELRHAEEQWTRLSKTLDEVQAAHEEELAVLAAKCNREIANHDELLRLRLEEQEEAFEAAIQQLDQQHQDQLRLLAADASAEKEGEGAAAAAQTKESDTVRPATGAKEAAESEAAYWKAQHSTLQERFDQLQRDYDDFAQDTAALQRRLREHETAQQSQEQSRTTRDAAAQQLTTLHHRLAEMTRLVEAAQADAEARTTELREAAAVHAERESVLQAELTSVRAQAKSSREEVTRLSDLNEELSELLQQGATGVEAALQDRDAQLAVLETQVRDLKLQLAASGDRLTERQTLLQELRDDRDSLQQLVEELKATNRTLEVQLRESRRVSEEQARVAAHEADRAVRDAEQARVAAQHALAEQHKSHQLNISALEAQLDDLRREVEVAQTVAATVPLEAQKHQRDLETVRERLTEALRSQQELQQQLKNSRGEVVRQRRLLRGVNADGSEVDTSAMNTTADAGAEEDGAGGAPTSAADARVNALLRTIEELEEKLHEASAERDIFQQERDRVTMQLKSAARVAEVKEQAMRRQEAELRSMRSQLTTIRDDLAQRVQSNHALQLEMDHLHERVADVTSANAELQEQHIADVERRTLQEHAEALLFAKAMTIPRALEDHISGLCAGYHTLLQVSSKDREYVYGRCDTIEKAAGEAMAEAEAQNHAYEVALADAQEEQQQLKDIIERLEEVLKKAEETKATAVAEAKAAKEELETVQRQAREDVFNAQRDLQMAELQHADTLHSLSLLQDEVTNTAALIKNQKATYERREAELMEEVAQLQAELEARKASVRVLQQSSDENRNMLQDVADQAEQQRDAAVREAQALRAQLERALPRLAQLEDEQAQRTADLMDTAQQLSALHKKSSSTEEVSRKHIEELNQTLQELLHAHAALQRTHSTTEATADRLKTQLESATQELERATTKAHHQEEEATQLRTRLQEVETRTNRVITDDQARLRDAERRIQGLEQRNTALQQECKSLQESQQSLRMEFESTADALQRLTEKANAQEQQQAHQIRLLRERADTLETERQALLTAEQVVTKERDGCQREILQLQHKIEHLQHHLSDANGHNETLNQEMVELKTEHASEVDRLRDAITDAQKELTKCRQLLAEAETHQVEQDSTHYSLTTEINVLREELKSARAQAEKAMQQYQKEKTEREEMATLLQSQMAQLYEELRSKQEQLRIIENTAANQLDTINALRQDVAELEERLKHTRKELLDVQEAATAAKEHHRRDRYELQSKLNIAEDAAAELTRQHNQYRERMTTKVELYEVAEQALRGEVTDLRADVARLEGALTATTQGKEAAEDVKSRQAHSIKAAETEVQTLRAQTARDMSELTALKVQLQQRTTEVERIHREAAAQLAAEKLRWEADHVAACDALEEALRREQQATRDAREARERALTSLERKQRDVAAMEEECRAMRAQVRHLQRRIDVAEYHLTALQGMARDSAADLGVSLEELTGGAMAEEGGLIAAQDSQLDTSGVTGSDAATMTTTTTAATAGAAVQAVLDELVRRLNIYTFVANTLDTEDAQLTALSQALEQQQDAVDALVEAGTAGDGVATTPYNTSGVTPLRGGRLNSTLGLNNTPAARGAPQSTPSAAAGSAAAVLPRSLTSAQQVFVQQISQASSTYVHRVEDHLRTAQQMLRSVAMAVGAHEVATGGRPSSSSTAAGSTAVLNSRPSTVALSSHHKLQVAATAAELHRRTAALTRAVDRVVEAIVGGASPAFRPPPLPSQASGGSYVGDAPSSPASPTAVVNLQAALLELRRMFAEAECFALLPFNELLCTGDTTTTTAAAAAAALSGLPGATASESEQMYGRRGRQGGRLQTPPRTQQQQAASSSTVLGAERHLTSATSDSVARRAPVPGAEAAVGSASRGGTASATQLAPPVVPSLALSSQLSTRRRADGAAPSRPRGDDSGVVSTLSPIPADDEANWF